ncbi:MAG: efflux RND transporter periplasmic adaptor subunit [Amphritea sp.]
MKTKVQLLLLGLLSIFFLSGCEEPPATEVIRPIIATRVPEAKDFMERSFPGQAKATQEVNLSFRVQGPLVSLPVDIGTVVKAGDLVAQIDPRDYDVRLSNIKAQASRASSQLKAMRTARPEDIRRLKADVDRARAQSALGIKEFKRVMSIYNEDRGAISQDMIDRAVAQRDRSAADLRHSQEQLRIGERGARQEDIAAKEAENASIEAAVNAAQDELDYTSLRAPFDGTIVSKYVENFEDVNAKQPIVRLLDSTQIEMVINIPEGLMSYRPYIERIEVTFDSLPGVILSASIFEVGQEASQKTRTFPVTLRMPQPTNGGKILPGMAGVARSFLRPPDAELGIQLPTTAVASDQEGKSFVWLLLPHGEAATDDSTTERTVVATRREVTVGKLTAQGIEVTAGVTPGNWIATAGLNVLREGQVVRLKEQHTGGIQ